MARIVLAMSGGVDSSVAAHLLREQGHEVIGLFMRTGASEQVDDPATEDRSAPESGRSELAVLPQKKRGCCSALDANDARRVADRLGIAFYALNFEREFSKIMDYFADEYAAGRTPNPCIVCNNWLKFGKLAAFAEKLEAQYVATGHYARITRKDEPVPGSTSRTYPAGSLLCGTDRTKDQSYVLFGLDRRLLPRLLFPVGAHPKKEIRALARKAGLRVAEKPDSQEICFVPDGDHQRLVRRLRPDLKSGGEVVDTAGHVVGQHSGIERYTIGQRRGLGIAFGEPRYVVALEPKTQRVVVGTYEELARYELEADRANWLINPPAGPIRCQVKIRYRHRPAPATVEPLPEGHLHVTFDEPQYGVAPGQAVVLYDADRVLGGGWIC